MVRQVLKCGWQLCGEVMQLCMWLFHTIKCCSLFCIFLTSQSEVDFGIAHVCYMLYHKELWYPLLPSLSSILQTYHVGISWYATFRTKFLFNLNMKCNSLSSTRTGTCTPSSRTVSEQTREEITENRENKIMGDFIVTAHHQVLVWW